MSVADGFVGGVGRGTSLFDNLLAKAFPMTHKQLLMGMMIGVIMGGSLVHGQHEYRAPKVAGSVNVTDDGTIDDWAALDADPLSLSWKGDSSAQPLNVQIQWAWDDEYLYTLVQETTPDDDPVAGNNKFDWLSGPDGDATTAQPWASDSVGFYDTGTNGFCCGEQGGREKVGPWTQWWVGLTPTNLISQENQVRMQARSVTDGGQLDDFLVDQDSPPTLVDDADGTLTGAPDRQIGEDMTFPQENSDFTREPHTAAGQNVDLGNSMRAIELRVPWDRLRYQAGENPSGDDIVDADGKSHTLAEIAPGYKFRNDPLLVDGVTGSSWQGQTFPGGAGDPRQVALADMTIVHLVAPSLPGDFNMDGVLDASDIDDLTRQSAAGMDPPPYDLNGDLAVNADDVGVWIGDLFKSWLGDANLDGEFNSGDLVVVLSSGTYEVDVDAVWSTGDFNGDGRTDSGDLVTALSDGGYELGPRAAVQSVPEPVGMPWVAIVMVAGWIRRRVRLPWAG